MMDLGGLEPQQVDMTEPVRPSTSCAPRRLHQILPVEPPALQTIEDQIRQAILENRIPNTDLAVSIFRNVLRFPDCLVLTRVGKFYEVSTDLLHHPISLGLTLGIL